MPTRWTTHRSSGPTFGISAMSLPIPVATGLVVDADKMPGARFFPDAILNFTENLLRRSDDTPAIVFRGEDKAEKKVSWDELTATVSRLNQAFGQFGLNAGDRICAVMPNMPETIMAFCAALRPPLYILFPPVPPACPSASCTAPAVRCCSISRSIACRSACAPATCCSTSPPAAG
jgi:acyl-CoA synthetase (AMP-forming)/AMP-acid ligase II